MLSDASRLPGQWIRVIALSPSPSTDSTRGDTTVPLGGSTVIAPPGVHVPIRKVTEETWPSPMPRSDRAKRIVPAGSPV